MSSNQAPKTAMRASDGTTARPPSVNAPSQLALSPAARNVRRAVQAATAILLCAFDHAVFALDFAFAALLWVVGLQTR